MLFAVENALPPPSLFPATILQVEHSTTLVGHRERIRLPAQPRIFPA
ncbi:MAG: hypothetical protein U0892_14715 [Pirellulales bacterium]